MTSASGKSIDISALNQSRHSACIGCGASLRTQVLDFGAMPISNSLLRAEQIAAVERFYPLRVMACDACSLVQLVDSPPAQAHFHQDYVYFSSYSASWLQHCAAYAREVIERFTLKPGDTVVEVASNDGYLLKFFRQHGLSVLGIEPSESVARAALAQDIPTEIEFFGAAAAAGLVARGIRPRLLVANNVFAHVPNLDDFTEGFSILLTDDSVLTAEVHYFRDLFENNQFDSFYHEHYSYYTVRTAERLFSRHGLRLFDVERLPTHGGSLRLYVCRKTAGYPPTDRLVAALREDDAFFEKAIANLPQFRGRVSRVCRELHRFLYETRRSGKTVAGFGAPAKATTLLNFAGITTDLLPYTVDSNPQKQGRYLPGVRIPILAPQVLFDRLPDFILVLPWNLKAEIASQLSGLIQRGTRLVCAIPQLEIS